MLKRYSTRAALQIDGRTPLWVASCEGHTECASELLDWGAAINHVDEVCAAVALKHLVRILNCVVSFERCVAPQIYHSTPLFAASCGGFVDCASELLDRGAAIEQATVCEWGVTWCGEGASVLVSGDVLWCVYCARTPRGKVRPHYG